MLNWNPLFWNDWMFDYYGIHSFTFCHIALKVPDFSFTIRNKLIGFICFRRAVDTASILISNTIFEQQNPLM